MPKMKRIKIKNNIVFTKLLCRNFDAIAAANIPNTHAKIIGTSGTKAKAKKNLR